MTWKDDMVDASGRMMKRNHKQMTSGLQSTWKGDMVETCVGKWCDTLKI